MALSTKYDWFLLDQPDVGALRATKEIIHQSIQSVAAVGRTFAPSDEREEDSNAKLIWVPGLWRMAGAWVYGESSFRSSISLKDKMLYLVDPRMNTLDELSLVGHNYNDLMLWVEQQIIRHNLSSSQFSTGLPYTLPNYATDFRKIIDDSSLTYSEILGGHYHNAFILFQSFSAYSYTMSDIAIYPHHFDMETKIILKDTRDVSTDTFVRLGFSPGDTEIASPYLYINGWPQITGEVLPKAPLESYWVSDGWYGLVLEFSHVYGMADQAEYTLAFLQEGLDIFKSLLLD